MENSLGSDSLGIDLIVLDDLEGCECTMFKRRLTFKLPLSLQVRENPLLLQRFPLLIVSLHSFRSRSSFSESQRLDAKKFAQELMMESSILAILDFYPARVRALEIKTDRQ